MDACTCPACVSACKRDPGRLAPEDVAVMAAHLSISPAELIAGYLVLIPAFVHSQKIFLLAPAKKKARRYLAAPGSVVPEYYARENGVCVFLSADDRCAIHEVKPFECRVYMGCQHTFLGRRYREEEALRFFISRWRKFQDVVRG